MTMTDDEFYDQQKAKIEAKFQEIDKLKINDELAESMKAMVEMIYFLEIGKILLVQALENLYLKQMVKLVLVMMHQDIY